jgi:hypothetical protein
MSSSKETLQEIINDVLDLVLQFLRKGTFLGDLFQHGFLVGSQVGEELGFVFRDTINGDFVEIL